MKAAAAAGQHRRSPPRKPAATKAATSSARNEKGRAAAASAYGESARAGEVIWYRAPRDFITESNMMRFFPAQDQPLVAQLNAGMRLAVYFAVVLALIKREINSSIVVLALAAALTYAVYETRSRRETMTHDALERLGVEQRYRGKKRRPGDRIGPLLEPQTCVPPTRDNPFMNPTLVDLADFPNRPPACPVTHSDVKRRMEKHHDHNLYRDVGDVFGRTTASRQFYTVPNTQIPNDQTAFAEWCYKTPPTCKEGNGAQCYANIMPTRSL